MPGIRYSAWNGICEVSPAGQFSLLYSSFRENYVTILTHKFSRKYFGLPLESSSTPLGVWEKDGHVAGKQILYQESTVSVLIGRIFQNGKQAFKNLEATLGPDISRKYVITFFLLSTHRYHLYCWVLVSSLYNKVVQMHILKASQVSPFLIFFCSMSSSRPPRLKSQRSWNVYWLWGSNHHPLPALVFFFTER